MTIDLNSADFIAGAIFGGLVCVVLEGVLAAAIASFATRKRRLIP
jgi:hypothetical protein